MIVTLLRVLRLSRAWCGALAIPTIWFYTAATGWEPSAIRASVMMTVVLGGWALKRPSDLLNSLAAAAFIILLAEPRQLFEASFQLSFFVMLTIALMLPPLNGFFDRILKHDPLLPDELVSDWKKILLWLARKFARYCGLSFAAWMGSIPLAAKYFHLFSPVSTPANLFAVPLGTFALMANLGALLCGHWLPWFTELFNHAAWFFMVAMTLGERGSRQNSRRVFLRSRTVAGHDCHLLFRPHRGFQRLVFNAAKNHFRRGRSFFHRRSLFLAMAVVAR